MALGQGGEMAQVAGIIKRIEIVFLSIFFRKIAPAALGSRPTRVGAEDVMSPTARGVCARSLNPVMLNTCLNLRSIY